MGEHHVNRGVGRDRHDLRAVAYPRDGDVDHDTLEGTRRNMVRDLDEDRDIGKAGRRELGGHHGVRERDSVCDCDVHLSPEAHVAAWRKKGGKGGREVFHATQPSTKS